MIIGRWSIGYSRDLESEMFAFGIAPDVPYQPAPAPAPSPTLDELSAAERARLHVHQHMLARARATAARQPDLVGATVAYSRHQAALADASIAAMRARIERSCKPYECQGFDDTPSP